jgi:hypothetical protein
VQAKISVERAVRSNFGFDGQLEDDQHENGTTNAQVDRRGGEGDDDGADGWNHQVGQQTDASEEDLDLLDTSVEQNDRRKDLVGDLRPNVLDGEAGDCLEDAHIDGS